MDITVTGRASMALAPERATVKMTLASEARDAESALARTTELVGHLTTHLERLAAVRPSPITWSEIEPILTRSWRPWSVKGNLTAMRYTATCEAQVKFSDPAALGHFVDGWVDVDGVTVHSVVWTLTDPTRTEQEAAVLRCAVGSARDRAQAISDAAGSGELQLVEIADPGLLGGVGISHTPTPYAAATTAAPAPPGTLAGPIQITPEDIELFAEVQARFGTE